MTFDRAISSLTQELEAIQAEEDEIRQKQEEVISRLEPKFQALTALGEYAHGIAEANAPGESVRAFGE